jgi:polyisoprenoid-binding protein YceI
MFELSAADGTLTVHTANTGVAAKAGHNLVITAERWRATVTGAPPQAEIELSAETDSLKVTGGSGGAKPLTSADRETIEGKLASQVFTGPQISFSSSEVDAEERRWQVRGALTINGRSSEIEFPLELEPTDGGTRLKATATLQLTAFGITPPSSMMGALKVADELQVKLDALAPARPEQP